MDYVKLALLVLQLVKYFIDQATKKKLIDEGRAQIVRENIKNALQELTIATVARQKVRDAIANNPSVSLQPDLFEKKD